MNECRPSSEWHRWTRASCPRRANVNRRAPSLRETGARDTQSCTVIHFAPRSVPTMLLTKCSAVAFRTQPFFTLDQKSTRLNSSHSQISYAVFCLKKKKKKKQKKST